MTRSVHKAVNRFITTLRSTSSINSSSDTGTFEIQDTSISGFSLPTGNCRIYMVLEFGQIAKEEIFRVTNITGNVCTYNLRIPVNGYSKPSHSWWASVRINDVADIINDISNHIDTFGYVERITGTQTINVEWWNYNGNGVTYAVANQTFAITWGQLVDNTTNYVYFNLTTNLFTVTQTATLTAAIQMASVVCSGGSITSIIDKRPAFFTTYAEIATKLDKTWGLRDGMGSSLQALEIDASGNEQKRSITIGSGVPSSTDLFSYINPSTRARSETTYLALKTDITSWGKYIQSVFLGEDISGTTSIPVAVVGSIKYTQTGFSATAGSFLLQWVRFTPAYDCILGTVKTVANASSGSATVVLHSDTWTLLQTVTVTNGTNTATFNYSLVAGTTYRLLLNDTVNFGNNKQAITVANFQSTFPYAISGVTNGVTDSVNAMNFSEINLDFGNKAFKARADRYLEKEFSYLAGFVLAPATKWAAVLLDWNYWLFVSNLSGLTPDSEYFISNTAWVLSLTPWTVLSRVGISKTTTWLVIDKEFCVLDATVSNGVTGTTAYTTSLTASRDFFAILVSYTLDNNWTGWWGLQIEGVNLAYNTTAKLKYFWRNGQVARWYASNNPAGPTGASSRIQVFYYD